MESDLQDGQHTGVAEVAASMGLILKPLTHHFQHWQRDRIPQLGYQQVCKQLRVISTFRGTRV